MITLFPSESFHEKAGKAKTTSGVKRAPPAKPSTYSRNMAEPVGISQDGYEESDNLFGDGCDDAAEEPKTKAAKKESEASGAAIVKPIPVLSKAKSGSTLKQMQAVSRPPPRRSVMPTA